MKEIRVRIKDNNNSPHGKFHRFLFPFSSRFSDLNFTSYALYIYLYYATLHTQSAWVTYVLISVLQSLKKRLRKGRGKKEKKKLLQQGVVAFGHPANYQPGETGLNSPERTKHVAVLVVLYLYAERIF